MNKRLMALISCALLLLADTSIAQQDNDPGHSIGRVSLKGALIVVELDEGTLGQSHLFDLSGRTLRFNPDGSKYRVENASLAWDSDFGPELTGADVNLNRFAFPFSGKSWKSFVVGTTGTVRFGTTEKEIGPDPYGETTGGISLGRFDQLADVPATLAQSGPTICVFLKPRLSGRRYLKELPDRAVVTWDLTEPFGGLLDFAWSRTVNQFQAVLHRNGAIEMSYKELTAKDGIVGLFPTISGSDKPASVHLSSLRLRDGPFAAVNESFHYVALPRPQDLSCTVIKALGDKFDFLAYYSDFRVDAQEASTPSDGPIGGNVTGIGQTQQDQPPELLASRCTQGRFQLGFAQPVFVGSNEMQKAPPDDAPTGGHHDLTFYRHQLAEATSNRQPLPYNYAIGHLGHEVAHRWGAYVSAKVNGEKILLGPWPHWARELETPVAYPYSQPTEASTLGGGAWQDNFDGTFTQLHDGYFVPASGYSYLDLYLMGFISAAEVPDFFILKNLERAGQDANGKPIFKGERTKISIQDVIAAEGERLPGVDHAQRQFNTGIVVIVEHGRSPSPELIEQANGIREEWLCYWARTTGHRASMNANPH